METRFKILIIGLIFSSNLFGQTPTYGERKWIKTTLNDTTIINGGDVALKKLTAKNAVFADTVKADSVKVGSTWISTAAMNNKLGLHSTAYNAMRLQGKDTSASGIATKTDLLQKQNLTDTTTYDATKNDVAIERNAKNDSISDLRDLIDTKVNLADSNIIYTTPNYVDSMINSNVEQTYIYAGTSPDGYILRSSDNGLTWSNLGSAGKGQPLAFCQLLNGNLLYSTDLGYIINYNTGYYIKVSNYPIRALFSELDAEELYEYIEVGDDNGQLYNSINGGISFNPGSNFGYKINDLINISPVIGMLILTTYGIYLNNDLIQLGNFTDAIRVSADTIYALTHVGNVFRSINAGTSWTDLGNKNAQKPLIKGNGSRIIYLNSGTDIYYTDDGFTTTHMALETEQSKACGTSISNTVIIGGKNAGADFFFISNDNGLTYPISSTFAGQDSINCIIAVTGSTYVQPSDLSIYETKVQHAEDTTLQRAWMNGLEARKIDATDSLPAAHQVLTATQAANTYLAKVDTNHFVNENDTNATSKLIETHTALMSDSVGKAGNAGGIIMTWLKTFILNRLASNDTIYKVITREKLRVIWMDSTEIDSIENLRNVDVEENGVACTNYAPTSTSVKNIGRSINTDTVFIKKGKPLIFRNSTINTNTLNDISIITNSDTLNFSWWSGSAWIPKFKITPTGQLIQTILTGSLTDNTPTASEINSITSLTPATAGRGYKLYILDSDGTGLVYGIVSDGVSWQYSIKTKAL